MTTRPGEEIHDSPVDWVGRHVRQYVESDGKEGHRQGGYESLLLTTRGRRSGLLRRTALFYGRDGERYVVVGSNGGSARHPLWYLNLLEQPEVTVQVGSEVFRGTARLATAEERPRLWKQMVGIFAQYEEYRQKAPREIPLVVIEPSGRTSAAG